MWSWQELKFAVFSFYLEGTPDSLILFSDVLKNKH